MRIRTVRQKLSFVGVGLVYLTALIVMGFFAVQPSHSVTVEVWKDPNCGCCSKWVAYMQRNGFSVKSHDTGNQKIQHDAGIPDDHRSCHTAIVAGYAVEGHVPAQDIKRLLDQKPDAIGLSVPGMVIGTPGMDDAVYQGRQDPYKVFLLNNNGNHEVFAAY